MAADTLHKEHARFMASYFTAHGVAAMAVLGDRDEDERRTARERLRTGEVKILFTSDHYNEGVDLPFVDCLLLLRPTESVTLFLQQLGRGLRLCGGSFIPTAIFRLMCRCFGAAKELSQMTYSRSRSGD